MPQSHVVTVILPVIDETWSLEETVRIVIEENPCSLKEILIVTASRTEGKSLETIAGLQIAHPDLIRTHEQTLPYLGGALREAFDASCGEFTVLMSSDLETDPHLVKQLVSEILTGECDVVTASRWMRKGSFHRYGLIKTFFINYLFQKVSALVFKTSLSDMTFGFRVYKTNVLRQIKWEELKHPFLFESLVKPLRMGYRVKEIPCQWVPRQEGRSHNTLLSYFGYLRIGWKVRVASINDFAIHR